MREKDKLPRSAFACERFPGAGGQTKIQQTGRLPPGTIGHHISSVVPYSDWQGDPRNIDFVRGQAGNLEEHGGNFHNPTTGPLIDRQALIEEAEGGG